MKRLHIELVLALQFDKAHRWSRRRLRDPLGVAIVVLLRLDVGSNIFRGHQPDVCGRGGRRHGQDDGSRSTLLDPDIAGRQRLRQPAHRVQRLVLRRMSNRAGRVEPDHAADVLRRGQRQAQRSPPWPLPPCPGRRRAYDAGRRGGPFHKLWAGLVVDELPGGNHRRGRAGATPGDNKYLAYGCTTSGSGWGPSHTGNGAASRFGKVQPSSPSACRAAASCSARHSA